MRRIRALPLAILLLAGCSRGDAPAADPTADPTSSEAASAASAPMSGIDAVGDPELAQFRLTTDNVAKATLASRYVAEVGAANPGLLKRLDQEAPLDGASTLQEAADRVASIPELRRALERAGLSAREYVMVSFTVTQAALGQAYVRAGQATRPSPAVSGENLDFVDTHRADIRKYLEAVRAMSPSSAPDGSAP